MQEKIQKCLGPTCFSLQADTHHNLLQVSTNILAQFPLAQLSLGKYLQQDFLCLIPVELEMWVFFKIPLLY